MLKSVLTSMALQIPTEMCAVPLIVGNVTAVVVICVRVDQIRVVLIR